MALLLGQYDFTVTPGATTVLTLVPNTTDSAGTYGPGEGEHKQEFRRLPGNVVRAIEEAVRDAVELGNDVEMDLDLDDAFPWDNQIDRIFINAKIGYAASGGYTLTRNIVGGNVRQWRLTT